MPRKTYTAEEKKDMLKMCEEKGVQKTSEETGVSMQTLYTWRKKEAQPADAVPQALEMPAEKSSTKPKQDACEGELLRLRIENSALKEQIQTLKKALRAFAE